MNSKDYRKIFRALALLTQLGLTILANISVGFFLGFLLDNLLQRDLIFKVIGLILGIISGFYSVYRLIMAQMGDD